MGDSLSTLGSIASFVTSSLPFLSPGLSGNAVIFVDVARQYVQQFTGTGIGSNSIPENYQGVITNLTFSDILKASLSEGDVSLDQLSVNYRGIMSPEGYATLADSQLKILGRHVTFARSLS